MRTIYRHAYKVKFKQPAVPWHQDRWAWSEYEQRLRDAEDWCEENTKGDWSRRPGEPGVFWFDKADDAVMCKLMFS